MAKIIADRRINQKTVNNQLDRVKANIRDSYEYFRPNYERFNEFRRFVFESSLTDDDITLMKELGKPQLEFNILEAYISRQRGEFAKQEPSLTVRAGDNAQNIDPKLVEVVENHIRSIFFDSNRDNMEYDIYTDLLSGGFSAMEVYTDYATPMSFDQNIYLRRVYDPTLVGFDKLAITSHKGDGAFAFKLYPKSREEFEAEYGTKFTKGMKFVRQIEGFNWSYETANDEIVLIADYYEKKLSEKKIVLLTSGEVMTVDEYDQMVSNWSMRPDILIQAPGVVGRSRTTQITTICRHRIVENGSLEYAETDFKGFPLIFVDGNSIVVRNTITSSARQLTRPLVYHAKSIQKLKNFAGITLANELENMVQHKFTVMKEAIPENYSEAYTNVQKASVLVYNGFKADDPTIQLPPPGPVPRVPAPPEVVSTFTLSDEMTQAILGTYDAALGINDNQLSGKAIATGAMQSNSAAMPYIVGYMKGLNRAAELIVDLLPKYYRLPRTIPVKPIGGKRDFTSINGTGQPQMSYRAESLDVKVEAGVNFEIQKQQALETLTGLMQVSPPFAAFMAERQGLMTLLSNVDMRGIDALKQGVDEFSNQMQQQKAQAQMMQQQMNPMVIKQQELGQKAQKDVMDFQIGLAQVANDKQSNDTKRLVALADVGAKIDDHELKRDQIDAEQARTTVMGAVEMADMHHQHAMDKLNLHHDIGLELHKINSSVKSQKMANQEKV